MSNDLHDAALLSDSERVQSLLAGGTDVNVRDAEGQTPLYLAAGAGDLAMVKLLVERGADVTACNDEGATSLHIAVMGNNKTVVAFLLGRGADVNAADDTGMTPLHCAALDGDKVIVKALLAKGADPSAQDNDGRTPIHFAQDFGHSEIVDLLQQVNLLRQLGDDDFGNAASTVSATQPARGVSNAQSPSAATAPLPPPSQQSASPPSPTKPCLKCGAAINVTAKFCGQCGTPAQAGPQSAPSPTTATSPAPSPAAASNALDALPDGTKLLGGAFAVSKVLGQGGFGITYYGGDMNLHRYVAIKEFFIQGECVRRASQVALQNGGDTAGFTAAKARFLREARTLARFDHPGIVRVYSVFEENNTVYMVMELLKGKTLLQLLEARGALPESEAVAFIVKVGAALEKVHQSSLLHRDINPSNILVCDDGRVVLIDFGLTKEIEKDTTYGTRKLSGTAVLGTASYAPIEQYSRSAQFGPPTDLYALGATLYHLLAGEAPIAATARAAGDDLLPLQQVKPGVSSSVSRAVAWAMAMDAGKRPQSVRAFLDSLTGKGSPPVTVAATPQVPATITTSPSATQPAGNAILPLPSPEAYSVKVSARILEWPFACACCGGVPDAAYTATFGKSGKRVIRQSSDSLGVPYCAACLKHQELVEAARKQLSAINLVRPASVPIPNPVPLAPLIPTPLPSASTGTVVLTPSQIQLPNPASPSASSNPSGGDEDTGSDWIDTVFACLCVGIFAVSFVGFWLGWFGKTSGFDVFAGTFVVFMVIAMLYGLRRKNRDPSHPTSSGGNPPALPGPQSMSPTSTTPSVTVAFDPRANKQVLDENASKVSNLLKGGFFILPIVFRLTGLAATFINAVIATAAIYLFIVPAVWLIFKLYYGEYDEQLENWNRTSKARHQAQDAALEAALQQAKEEQARLQAAQDAAYLAAKQKAQDGAQYAALNFDAAWGRLRAGDLVIEGQSFQDVTSWWQAALQAQAAQTGTGITTPAAHAVAAYQQTDRSFRTAEETLRPWVIRHMKSRVLPQRIEDGLPASDTSVSTASVHDMRTPVPRRIHLPGHAIVDDTPGDSEIGIEVGGEALLPFLLAARAAVCAPDSRPVFAEGLASSYEAFLHTRQNNQASAEQKSVGSAGANGESHSGAGILDSDDDNFTFGTTNPVGEWYLDQLDKAIPLRDHRDSACHPKVAATARRVLEAWRQGEKVLVFCHFIATGRVLRQVISGMLHDEILRMGAEKLQCSLDQTSEQLERLGKRFFDNDSPVRRAADKEIVELLREHSDLHCHEQELVEVLRRYLRTPSFLVRFFPLEQGELDESAVHRAFAASDVLGLRAVLLHFLNFLGHRCGKNERERYLEAVKRLQTGSMLNRDENLSSFSEDEKQTSSQQEMLLPNVRLVNGAVKHETRQRLMLGFNSPFFPEVLVASSVMAEGVDLHRFCRYVIHHDLCWNPSTLEQRIGRIDRIDARAEQCGQPIRVYLPYLAATQDEKMYRVVTDRERWFNIVMGENFKVDVRSTDQLAERIPLPAIAAEALSFRLQVNDA